MTSAGLPKSDVTCVYCGSKNLHEFDNSTSDPAYCITCFDCWATGPLGENIDDAWSKLARRYSRIAVKQITVWKKFNVKEQRWYHNHIEYGHVPLQQTHPTGSPEQTKTRGKCTWISSHKHLNDKSVVI